MSAVFKPDETFRGDFIYAQQPGGDPALSAALSRDNYMYSVNIEPHVPGPKGSVTEFAFDVDEHYVAECRERALVLAAEPLRYQALPHMMSSQWDCLELIMESLARDYPQHFSLQRQRQRWHWINRPLGTRPEIHLWRCLEPAARAAGLHHPAGAGRFCRHGPARRATCGRKPAW